MISPRTFGSEKARLGVTVRASRFTAASAATHPTGTSQASTAYCGGPNRTSGEWTSLNGLMLSISTAAVAPGSIMASMAGAVALAGLQAEDEPDSLR